MSSIRIFSLLFIFIVILPVTSQADPALDSVRQLMIHGQADQAIRVLKASISVNPSGAEEHNLLCRVHYSEERWDAAVSECERAVALNPLSSAYHLWLGRAYGEKADHSGWLTAIGFAKKSRTAFEKAVELDPNSVEARSDVSEYYVEAPGFLGGGTEKAAAQANAVERLEPATAFWIRARIAEHGKKITEAEQHYKKAIQIEPDSPRRLFDLASFYRRVNRFDELESAIQKASQLNRKNDSTLVDSASLLLRSGRNLPLATTLLQRYIERGTKSEDAPVFQAQYLLGQILEKSGNTQAAKQAYLTARASASEYALVNSALKRLGA